MAITTTEGSYQDYGYTGGMQSVTIPHKGIYKFEVWGAGGAGYGQNHAEGAAQAARGGYSVGYRLCNAGEVYYICVGGSGTRYNGGGEPKAAGTGGDATHIATVNALLRNLASNIPSILIVAGGGGGAGQSTSGIGGAGGGLSGDANFSNGGGTQTAGGSGYPHNDSWNRGGNGSFGVGGYAGGYWAEGGMANGAGGSGGAGFYGGGGGGAFMGGGAGGGGGSGYIGGLPAFTAPDGTTYTPSTTAGAGSAANTGGMARITYVKPDTLPVVFNGTRLTRLIFNGVTVKNLIYNGRKLYARATGWGRRCVNSRRARETKGGKTVCLS